jgi:hypothetical protein
LEISVREDYPTSLPVSSYSTPHKYLVLHKPIGKKEAGLGKDIEGGLPKEQYTSPVVKG